MRSVWKKDPQSAPPAALVAAGPGVSTPVACARDLLWLGWTSGTSGPFALHLQANSAPLFEAPAAPSSRRQAPVLACTRNGQVIAITARKGRLTATTIAPTASGGRLVAQELVNRQEPAVFGGVALDASLGPPVAAWTDVVGSGRVNRVLVAHP